MTSLQKRAVEAASKQSNVTFRIEALTGHPLAAELHILMQAPETAQYTLARSERISAG